MYALRKIQREMENDAKFAAEIEALKASLVISSPPKNS
jgi:chromosomal replication initiation ATPase DnaA